MRSYGGALRASGEEAGPVPWVEPREFALANGTIRGLATLERGSRSAVHDLSLEADAPARVRWLLRDPPAAEQERKIEAVLEERTTPVEPGVVLYLWEQRLGVGAGCVGFDLAEEEDRVGTKTPFLKGIAKIALPVRHGEGKMIIKDEATRQHIVSRQLNCLTYCDESGNPTDEYPGNPNGAELNCAGLTNPSGQVFGLMPHPEAYLSLYNHPNWGQMKRRNPNISEEGEGLAIFKNIVRHIGQSKALSR